MIEAINVSKTFGDHQVLKNISVKFEKGKKQPDYRTKWFG